MLFRVNDQTEVDGLDGMAPPGTHHYTLLEVTTNQPLFHVDVAVREEENDDDVIVLHFIATKAENVLQLIANDRVKSASIFLHTKKGSNHEIHVIEEIYQAPTTSGEPAYFYHLDNDKKVRDFFPLSPKLTGEKECIYRHGKGLLVDIVKDVNND